MKRTLQYAFILLLAFVLPCLAHTQAAVRTDGDMTLKSQMEVLHKHFGINFVYDSSLDLDIPYRGEPMKALAVRESLESCLETLFKDTGIRYEINSRYVVLVKADSKKKPRQFTIFIEEQRDTLTESSITAFVGRQKNATQTGLTKLDSKKFQRGFYFMSSPDVIKTLQMLPGVSGGAELFSGLHVYGGDGYDNLYLMDGIPMYQAGHLAGLFSAFNTDVIETVDFYKSGFPARYGGRLSSVVDVRTREGDFNEYHGNFSIGLLDSRFSLEGPIIKGKTSFNLGLRGSWLDVISIPAFALINRMTVKDSGERYNAHYRFWDANARLTHRFAPDNTLSLNFYMGRDNLGFGIGVEDTDEDRSEVTDGDLALNWGNMVTSLNWDLKLSDNLYVDASLFHSQNRSSYELTSVEDNRSYMMDGTYDRYWRSAEEYNIAVVNDLGAKVDFDWYPSESHHIRFGTKLCGHLYSPRRGISVEQNIFGRGESETESVRKTYNCLEPSLYVEDEMRLASWLEANVGLRYAFSRVKGKTWHSVEPRVALSFRISPMVALKASYTEMSQFAHCIASTYIDLPFNMWMPSTAGIKPSRARQAAAGVYLNLPHGMNVNVEGWYKTMDNLYEYGGTGTSIFPSITTWETSFREGKGKSWGASAEFGYRTEKTDVTASYTLSWNFRRFDAFWHDWYPDRNDHRHRINITASHRFTKRFDAYIGWNWRKGSRITVLSHIDPDTGEYHYTSPNNLQLGDYHRLDLGFNFRKTTRRGNESIWNLSIYNAYCRMNPFYANVYRYKANHTINGEVVSSEDRPKGLNIGLIPIVPTFSYTLKF